MGMTKTQGLRPVCKNCGGTVSAPKEIDGLGLRANCRQCGRVDAEWVKR